jgi:serine/threonine protein kinase
VCLGIKHMHDRKCLHRDIKPANIFIHYRRGATPDFDSEIVVLGDMGL